MQVVITIEGSQADVLEQEPDEQVQFSTDGEYTCVDGCGMLTYPESELTGMAGTLTTITFTPSNAVLKRTGAVTSRMVFAPARATRFCTRRRTARVRSDWKRSATAPRSASAAACWSCCMLWILTTPAPTATGSGSPSENNKDYRIEGN